MADARGIIGQTLTLGPIPLFEADQMTLVDGEAANVVVLVLKDGAVAVIGTEIQAAATVAELGAPNAGRYFVSFVPLEVGNYAVEVRHLGQAVHMQSSIRVDTVDMTHLAGFAVVPLGRGSIDIGNAVEFKVRFVLPDGTPFEPAELRMVEITNADTNTLLFQIGAADIESLGDGTYRVLTPVAIGEAMTLRDRWYFKGFHGPEVTRAFTQVVAKVVGAGDLLVSVERLKRHELKGADLRDNQGVAYDLATYEEAIREATDEISAEIDVILAAKLYEDERYDYRMDHYGSFGWFTLDRVPLQSVTKVRARYNTSAYVLDFPVSWVVIVNKDYGQFNLVPEQGTLEQFMVLNGGNSGALLPIIRRGIADWWPGLFEVTYRAGYEPGNVPGRIQKAIALKAAIEILNIAGEMILGSGIASKSISIGGLSQSVSTTSSATNAGHGALILQYEKQLKTLLPNLRRQHHGVSLGQG
jgi:hypothetical protein